MIKITAEDAQNALELANQAGVDEADFKHLLKNRCVHLNGNFIKKDCELQAGDILELFVEEELPELIPAPQIVYEDENLIIFNKPAGIACDYSPDGGRTLMLLAEEQMRSRGEYNAGLLILPYLCTPIDQFTGGLVVVAKDENVFKAACEAVRQRRLRRFYTGITACSPVRDEAELHSFMTVNNKKDSVKIQDRPGNMAQPVVTRYRVTSRVGDFCRVEAEPVTSKPHQLRAQFSHMDAPFLGDEDFGYHSINRKMGLTYESLWLTRLEFCVGENNILSYLDGRVFECVGMLPELPEEYYSE